MARRCANRSVAGGGCHKVEWWPGWTDVVRHRRISAGRQRFDPTGRCVGDEKRLPDPADRRRCRAYLSSAARRRLAPAPEIHGSTSPSSSATSSLAGLVSNAHAPPRPPPGLGLERPRVRAPQSPLLPPLSVRPFCLRRLLAGLPDSRPRCVLVSAARADAPAGFRRLSTVY
jgi:hypothetical protein